MTWLSFVTAAVASIAVLAIVGGSLSWALGLRGMWAVAGAPAFAMCVIGIASTVAPWAGIAWSPLPVVVVTLLLVAAISLVRRRWVRFRAVDGVSDARRFDGWLVGALVLGSLFVMWRVCVAIGEPANFSQTFDNNFHLNAVRYVLDTVNASSLHIGSMTSPRGTLPFYPAAWHALVSLVVGMTGVAIPVGVNAVTMVVSAVVWPLGIVLLSRTLFGPSPVATVAAVVAAVGIPAFPFLLMDYGVLYPFQLGLSLVPIALAATLQATGSAGENRMPRPWWALVLAGTIPGLALAHPGAFVVVLALTLPIVVLFAWRLFRRAAKGAKIAVAGGFVAYLGTGVVLLRTLRPPPDARGWPPGLSVGDAIGQVLTASMWYALPAFAIAAALLAGLIAAIVERSRQGLLAAVMYLVAAGLYVAVSSFTYQPLRDILTGSWYNNMPRVAAILPLTMVPLAAYGADRVWRALRGAVRVRGAARVAGVLGTAAVAVAAVVSVITGPVTAVTTSINALYRITPESTLIDSDEWALLQRLDAKVPADAVVAGNAWTGAGLAYALADRRVTMPHILTEESPELSAINEGLAAATPDSPACDALRRANVGFVLDFGDREVFPGTHAYRGLQDLATSPAVRLVDSQGEARLYQIVACG